MGATSKGEDWRLRHSLWIAWTFALGFFSWLAFLYVGARTQRLRWKLWGLAYGVPPAFVILIPDDTAGADNSGLMNFFISLTVGCGLASIIHAFLIRREYLLRLEMIQQESSNVSVTSQGKRWELLQSFWILGTFTVVLFSWLSFLYIGIRAKRLVRRLCKGKRGARGDDYGYPAAVWLPGGSSMTTGICRSVRFW